MTSRLKGWTIVVHRWLGVGLCLVFLVWFSSAIGIAYWDYPAVDAADRLDHSPPLDATTIVVSPDEALRAAGFATLPADMRLSSFDGRPVYRIRVDRTTRVDGTRRTARRTRSVDTGRRGSRRMAVMEILMAERRGGLCFWRYR